MIWIEEDVSFLLSYLSLLTLKVKVEGEDEDGKVATMMREWAGSRQSRKGPQMWVSICRPALSL